MPWFGRRKKEEKNKQSKEDPKGKGKETTGPKSPRGIRPPSPKPKPASPRGNPSTPPPISPDPSSLSKPPPKSKNTGKEVPFFQFSSLENASAVRFIDHSCHCFAAFFMGFKYASVSPFQFCFSLFDCKNGITLSEEVLTPISIVEQVKYGADEEKQIEWDKRGMLFKDLTKEEMSKGEYWLVCRVVKTVKLKIGDEEKEGVRVPVGWGAISLREAIGDQAEEGQPLEDISAFSYVDDSSDRRSRKRMEETIPAVSFKVYEKPTDMPCQEALMRLTSGGGGGGLKDIDMTISVASRLDPIPNEHAHLGLLKKVGKSTRVVDRLSLFIHTTSSQAFDRTRNELYVSLTDGIFPDCPKNTFVTVTMSVKQFSGQEVKCLSLGTNGEMTNEVTFTIDKRETNAPQFGELCIINLNDLPGQALHLSFSISLSETPDYLDQGQCLNAFLKITNEGKFLNDGNYKLKCFWRAPGTNRMDNVYYIKNAANTTFSTGKDFLNLRTSLGSSMHTQHKDLNAVLHWQEYPTNMFKSMLAKSIMKGTVEEAEIFRVFSKIVLDLLEVYHSEKHTAIKGDIMEVLYTLVKLCVKPRENDDTLSIAGSSDLSCLLGYFLLASDVKLSGNYAVTLHQLFVGFLNRICEEVDGEAFRKVQKIDWPSYDQYLGLLLAGWGSKNVLEVIARNKKRRETRREKKTVRFTLPTKEELDWGRGEKKEEESWSVEEWLEQIGMGKYISNFQSEGYNTLDDVQGLSLASLEKMSVNVPRHRKKLLEESERLC